jgi:hypothetical protein
MPAILGRESPRLGALPNRGLAYSRVFSTSGSSIALSMPGAW